MNWRSRPGAVVGEGRLPGSSSDNADAVGGLNVAESCGDDEVPRLDSVCSLKFERGQATSMLEIPSS